MKYYNDYSQLFEAIISLNKYKTIIEIGVNSGDTTVSLCRGAKQNNGKVYGFDLWSTHGLYNQFQQSGSKEITEKKIKDNGLDNFELFVKNSFDKDFSTFVQSKVKNKYDFVFIDGCHSYKGILNDFAAVYKYLSDIGTIAFHDTQRIDGCREFIYDLRTKFYDGTYDIIDFPGGYDGKKMGVSLLTKKTFPLAKIPIDQLCGSISTPKDIEKKEQKLFLQNLSKYKNNIDITSIDIDSLKLAPIDKYRNSRRKYAE